MSLWLTHPLFVPSAIVGVTIVLWATSLLPEFITALLFFTAAMTARIAPPEVILAALPRLPSGWCSAALCLVWQSGKPVWLTGLHGRSPPGLPTPGANGGQRGSAELCPAFVMPSNMGRIALLMPIVAAMAKRAGIADGSRAWFGGAGRWFRHLPAFGHHPACQRS